MTNRRNIVSCFLAACSLLAISTPAARSNAETRHTLVLPGTCIEFGAATVTFNRDALTLTSSGPGATAAAVVTSTIPNIGLTNFPIPQGILTFTGVHSNYGGTGLEADYAPTTQGYNNEYEIVGFYQNGSVLLQQGSLANGTKNFSVNTAQSGMGQLLAVSFLYVGGEEMVGVVTVSNFRINNIPANGFDLSHPQTCSPYVPPIFNGCWGCS